MHSLKAIPSLAVFFALLVLFGAAAPASAEPSKPKFNPAIIYLYSSDDSDRSFIGAARSGIEKASREFGMSIPEYRVKNRDEISATIKRVADSGASPIIALGYQNVTPVLNLAERYPHTRFTVIDGLVPPLYPNVQSIIFRDNEGAFLVGLIAGKTTKMNRVGFVGGMDIPLIRNFATGYEQGVKYANPAAEVAISTVGDTPDAWSNPVKAHSLAIAQYSDGADVIFAAAGGSGIGVLKAASETNKYAIGVDSNQNSLYPGRVLTSLVKRVDIAVYDTLKASHDAKWNAGIKYLGIKEGALDYAVDQNNRDLISEQLIEYVANAKDRIINGTITVDSYSPK